MLVSGFNIWFCSSIFNLRLIGGSVTAHLQFQTLKTGSVACNWAPEDSTHWLPKRCNPRRLAKMTDNMLCQVAAITLSVLADALSFIFSRLLTTYCFTGLTDWNGSLFLIWRNCPSNNNNNQKKNTQKTAIYWLLSFTLAPSNQATNTLWCLIAWDGLMTDDSWHQFALQTDMCGLRMFP